MAGDHVPQRLLRRFRDADPSGGNDGWGTIPIRQNSQIGCERRHILSIVVRAGDAERLRQASRSAGEHLACSFRRQLFHWYGSPSCHQFKAAQRFERANQYASRMAGRQAGHVQAVMVSVDEIDIGVSWRTEQDFIAGCLAGKCVCCGVIAAHVHLDLDDPARDLPALFPSDQDFAQQLTRYLSRVSVIETSGQCPPPHFRGG